MDSATITMHQLKPFVSYFHLDIKCIALAANPTVANKTNTSPRQPICRSLHTHWPFCFQPFNEIIIHFCIGLVATAELRMCIVSQYCKSRKTSTCALTALFFDHRTWNLIYTMFKCLLLTIFFTISVYLILFYIILRNFFHLHSLKKQRKNEYEKKKKKNEINKISKQTSQWI